MLSSKAYNKQNLLWFCLLLVNLISIAASYYIEFALGYDPCPLCILQRWSIISYTIALFIFLIIFCKFIKTIAFLAMLFSSSFGLVLACRQLWLMHLPKDQIPSCSAGIEQLFNAYPFFKFLQVIFKGTQSCAEQDFLLLGFSLAHWSALLFAISLLSSLYILFGCIKKGGKYST